DFSHSEFGTLCSRFWRGRIPFHFGGGNSFVDVRDVALGHLRAAERGRTGERYLLAGSNRSFSDFFSGLARAARRAIFRLRLPNGLGADVAWPNARRRRSARAYLAPCQARMVSLFFYFRSDKAERELGYRPRPLRESLNDAHAFWMGMSRQSPTRKR